MDTRPITTSKEDTVERKVEPRRRFKLVKLEERIAPGGTSMGRPSTATNTHGTCDPPSQLCA